METRAETEAEQSGERGGESGKKAGKKWRIKYKLSGYEVEIGLGKVETKAGTPWNSPRNSGLNTLIRSYKQGLELTLKKRLKSMEAVFIDVRDYFSLNDLADCSNICVGC